MTKLELIKELKIGIKELKGLRDEYWEDEGFTYAEHILEMVEHVIEGNKLDD